MKKYSLGLLLAFLLIAGTSTGQPNTGFIDVKEGKLYYETAGNGKETIVFIHDGLVHGVVWDDQFSKFAEKYHVVRYDRRGYGRSPKPEKTFSNIQNWF